MDGGTATGAFADRGLFLPEQILFSSSAAACVCTSSRAIASMPDRNSPGSAAPFAICVRLFSHSAVSCGEVSISGRIQIRLFPFW